MLLLRNKDEQ